MDFAPIFMMDNVVKLEKRFCPVVKLSCSVNDLLLLLLYSRTVHILQFKPDLHCAIFINFLSD